MRFKMTDKISIVITTHGKGRDLPGILNSIECQRQYRSGISTKGQPYNYEAGDYFTKAPIEVVLTWDGDIGRREAWDERGLHVVHVENVKAVVPCCGHNTREAGIQAATGDWIYLTNSDNLLVGGWLHSVMQCCLPQYGIIYFDIVSNLWTWQAPPARLEWGACDLSSVVVKSEIAKEVGFPFRAYDGDFEYIDACNKLCQKKGLRTIHINEILAIHN